jgi:SNF2 family DNA or RNA helicase
VTVRQDSVKKFNTNAASQVYLISTRAGGVGLNIHGANRVVIFDFKYTPADEQQAIGRAYRLGQTKPVYVYWLLCLLADDWRHVRGHNP